MPTMMTIAVPELDNRYKHKLYVYDEMVTFVERCQNEIEDIEKFQFEVGLGEPGYHLLSENHSWISFKDSYKGIANTFDIEKRTPYEKKDEILKIYFQTTLVQYNSVANKIRYARITVGGHGNTHQPFIIIPITEKTKYGLYKNKFFDEGFQLMKKIHPSITEEEFAIFGTKSSKSPEDIYQEKEKYNEDFVDERIVNNDDYILTREEVIILDDVNGKINVEFSIMTIDIERNSDLLIEILKAL